MKRMKADHLKEIDELRSTQTYNDDLNLKRLKKMYADLKKDKLEQSFKHLAKIVKTRMMKE